MTIRHTLRPTVACERGMALISALLLLMVMSGLAIALTASGRIEVAMGDNEELYAGARAAAESGLNHAAAQILALAANPLNFPLNDLLEGPDGVVDTSNPSGTSNLDNGWMTDTVKFPQMAGFSPCLADANISCWPVTGGSPYAYSIRLYDDDDPLMSRDGLGFSPAELVAMGPPPDDPPEDGSGVNDVNKRIVIRAIGYGPRNARATLEQMLTPIKMPALLVDGDLRMGGSASIQGSQGSVHSNGNLEIDGTRVRIAENATTTGTLDPNPLPTVIVGEMSSGGMPEIPVFDIWADNYINEADFVLRANGTITVPGSNVALCTAGNSGNGCRSYIPLPTQLPNDYPVYTAPFGWTFSDNGPDGPKWTLLNGSVISATYFAESLPPGVLPPGGNVEIGGTGATPLYLSIIAEGNISLSGTPNLLPEPNSELMFVTNMDLDIAGDLTQLLNVEGRVLVREQIHFTGNASLVGQVIVQDVTSVSDLVEDNVVEGNFTLTYNGLIETVAYTVSGWRETP